MPEPETTGNFKAFQLGLIASTYLMPLAKSIELLCGLSFVTGKFVTLANIIILPITLNILFINFFLSPEGIPIAIFIFLGNLFLIYTFLIFEFTGIFYIFGYAKKDNTRNSREC